VDSGIFETAISQTGFAASTNVSRPVLTGLLLRLDKENLSMVATDSYRLSEKMISLKKGVEEVVDCIVPSKTIMELGKILSSFEEKEVNCQVTKNQILFSIGNLRIISRLIDGSFPDYKKIIPTSSKTRVKIGVQEFILAVRKVSLFVQETNNNIKVSVTNNGKLIVSTDETQIGEGTAEVDVEIEGENNKIALNAQYLLDALAHIKDESIEFLLDNKLSPVTITPVKKEAKFTHIIMPLKL